MKIQLGGGSYKARSIISSAQRCVNLFSEQGHAGAIIDTQGNSVGEALAGGVRGGQSILYPTPGTRQISVPPTPGAARGLYWSTSDVLFYVCGSTLYKVASDWSYTVLGTIAAGTTPVSMADNGTTLILVDGTDAGYQVDLVSLEFRPINAANNSPPFNTAHPEASPVFDFPGANRVAMLDGYFIFNHPSTGQYFASYNGEPASDDNPIHRIQFDSTWWQVKNGYPDLLVAAVVNQRSIWLIGERTTEIHYDAGSDNFPFQVMDGPYVEHGCVAKHSIARLNESILWLSQDQTGRNMLVMTSGYQVVRVSTHAIETEWSNYAEVSDATATAWQQNGHVFYQLDFPSADKSWRYDVTTREWHEAVWTDTSGAEHRHRAGRIAFAYGVTVGADWENGNLYAIDPNVFTDVGRPIVRRRDFPHIVNDGNRTFFKSLILDMDVGLSVGTSDGPPDTSPQVLLRWSDDRGRTFNNPVAASLGATGDYLTSVQFLRLGMGRDRVFSCEWDAPVNTALQGAWLTLEPVAS
jgi:hypothetical protein